MRLMALCAACHFCSSIWHSRMCGIHQVMKRLLLALGVKDMRVAIIIIINHLLSTSGLISKTNIELNSLGCKFFHSILSFG